MKSGKGSTRKNIAGILFGIGLACGLIPIALASLLMRENLFLVCIDRMDAYWKETNTMENIEA